MPRTVHQNMGQLCHGTSCIALQFVKSKALCISRNDFCIECYDMRIPTVEIFVGVPMHSFFCYQSTMQERIEYVCTRSTHSQ